MKKFLVADDHVTVRLGIELLISDLFDGSCIIKQAGNGQQVLDELNAEPYDMLVMDMNMPEPGGFVLLKKALEIQKGLNILVVSVNPEAYFAPQVIIMGALGYINKSAEDTELKKALRMVAAGNMYLPGARRNDYYKNPEAKENSTNVFLQLSERENQVMVLLLRGHGVLEVSNVLGISSSAAGTLKGRLFKKLKIESMFELYRLARQYNLMNDETIQY